MKQRIVMGWVMLTLAGCAVDVQDGAELQGDVAQVEQEIVGGTKVNKRGVVELDIKSVGKCTGVMINDHWILTAKSCVLPDEESYVAAAAVWYFDPALPVGTKRRLTETPLDGGYDLVFGGNWEDGELTLLWRADGWIDTDVGDYQRLSLGTCENITPAMFYGRGTSGSGKGNGAGVLRTHETFLDWCPWLPVGFADWPGFATCPGDMGGPYIAKAGQHDVVTGILTRMSGGTPECSNGGTDRSAVRFYFARDWMEWMMGDTCHDFTVEDHPYIRCWD